MKKKIESLLNIFPSDWYKLTYLSLLNFIFVISNSIGITLSLSLFLKRAGVENIPYIYILNSVIILFVSIIYFFTADRYSTKKFLSYISLIAPMILISVRFLLNTEAKFPYYTLIVLSNSILWIYLMGFWNFAIEITSLRQGKRIFSIVIAMGIVGGIAGGSIVKYADRFMDTKNLIFVWAIGYFLILFFLKFSKIQKKAEIIKNTSFREIFSFIVSSRLLLSIAISFFLFAILITFLEFHFNIIIDKTFINEEELTRFLGTYTVIFNIILIIFILFFNNRILNLIGVTLSILIIPITLFLGFSVIIFIYIFPMIFVFKLLRDIIGNSLFEAAYPLLYDPLPSKYKLHSIIFTDGIITQIGTGLAGISMLFYRSAYQKQFLISASILSLVYIIITLLMKYEYTKALKENLNNLNLIHITSSITDIINPDNPENFKYLTKLLETSSTLENERFIFSIISETKNKKVLDYIFSYLNKFDEADPSLVFYFSQLKRYRNRDIVIFLKSYLQSPLPDIQAEVIKDIAFIEPALSDGILKNILSKNKNFKVYSAIILYNTLYKNFNRGLKNLNFLLKKTNNSSELLFIIEIIRDIIVYIKRNHISDFKKIKIILYIVKKIVKKNKREATEAVIDILRILQLKYFGEYLFENLFSDNQILVKSSLKVLMKYNSNLIELLLKKYISIQRLNQYIIYIAALRFREMARDEIISFINSEISIIYDNIFIIYMLDKSNINERLKELFKDTFNKENNRRLFFILKILFSIYNIPLFEHDIKKIFTASENVKSQAIEFIDSNLKGYIRKKIIPLLEIKDPERLLSDSKRELSSYELIKVLKGIISSINYSEWFKGIAIIFLKQLDKNIVFKSIDKNKLSPFLKESLES